MTVLVVIYTLAPILVVVASAFSPTGYMSFPPESPSLRWFSAFLSDVEWMQTLLVTAILALSAALLSVLLGFSVALVAVRKSRKSRSVIEFLVLLPLVFPHAALAIAVLSVVASFNLLGTFTGVLFAHLVLTLPYAYRPIATSLEKLDISNEEAAMSLGASPITVFRRVTLPLVRPGLITAMLFCFILSFDESTVTLFLVGPNFITLPIKIFSQLQDNASPIVGAVSVFMIALTGLAVLVINWVFGLELFVQHDRKN
jgi:putative spermidine/putrescine transport system permease protein